MNNGATAQILTSDSVETTMHAIVHRTYGSPDQLSYERIARPIPGDDAVLVRVHAAGVSIGDHHIVSGKPYVIRPSVGGLFRPGHPVPGATMSGRVEAIGANVKTLRPGDEVYGQAVSGAFAEYLAVPAAMLAPKPKNLSFEEAAAAPWAVTALQALRDSAELQSGQRVLINGASGGVGTWAVQIAKALGARVTAVCSTRHVELIRALGADEVIDYTKADFVEGGRRFEVMMDTVGNRSLTDCRKVLIPGGRYVSCSGGTSGTRWMIRILEAFVTSQFTTQKMPMFIVSPNQKDLLALTALIEAGQAKPVIEHVYALHEAARALNHVGKGHSQGQTVIRIRG